MAVCVNSQAKRSLLFHTVLLKSMEEESRVWQRQVQQGLFFGAFLALSLRIQLISLGQFFFIFPFL